MPGLLMQDPGFFLEKGTAFSSSNGLCSQGSSDSELSSENGTVLSSFVGICSQDSAACSAVQEDKICTITSSPILSDSSEDNSVLRGCGISGILPYKHRCTSSLMRETPSHALSSWAPPSIDVNVNEEDPVSGFQDYESLWPDIAESVKESSSLSGCKNGIMFGNLCNFQKDVAKGSASFSTECLQGRSPTSPTAACLSKYLTSLSDEDWNAELVYASDEFRMYEFKVRRCTRGRSHDWTECPFAHPGEKARRRDPRRFHYSGTACPDFRKGNCKRGDACEFAHGVFECWLHPARYRTQPCKDGRSCMRRICFFAHTPDQLRLVPAASSALKIGGFFDFQSNSPMYQNALLSDQNCSEDFSDENAMFEMLGSTGSFDGSHYLRVRSPHDHHNFCTSPLMASPTSTLACISRSPPSISPPISPSPSPASPHTWNGRFLSPALPITAATRGYPLLPSSRSNFPRVQALLAAAQTDAVSFTPPHKSVSSFSLNSTPHDSMSLSFPNYAHSNLRKSFSSAPTSPSGVPSSSRKTLNDLVTAVQQLDLNNVNQIWYPRSTSPHATVPSPLSRTYSSTSYNPSSLSDNCFEDIFEDDSKLQRVESGKALRAEFYGKIAESAKQRDQDESPDLGWVNDLLPE